MTIIKKLNNWSETYHKPWMDLLRMATGLVLIIKGFLFLVDAASLQRLLEVNLGPQHIGVAYFIAGMHLLTGFLIFVGMATRISCLLQIPVVATAVFWAGAGEAANAAEIFLAVIVLLLLCFFLIKGSGKFSAYYYVANSRNSRRTDESRKAAKGVSLGAPMDDEGNLVANPGKI